MSFRTYNEHWATLGLKKLAQQGITDFFIAPGSRSSALALAAENNSKINTHIHFDERGLAFYALGHAKKTGRVPAIITTSGSAVANLFPAIVEAHQSLTPLMVLTADRPPELLGVGANQAIDQKQIFQNYAEYFEISPAEKDIPVKSLLTTLSQACAKSKNSVVHINWQFREDLPTMEQNPEALPWENHPGETLILVSSFSKVDSDKVLELSEHLKAPILVDIQHPLRFQSHPHILSHGDLLLRKFHLKPHRLIQFGGDATSKVLLETIHSWELKNHIQVLSHDRCMDSQNNLKSVVVTDPNFWIQETLKTPCNSKGVYLQHCIQKETQCTEFLDRHFEIEQNLSEQKLAYRLSQTLPEKTNLFVSNSRPIRDMDQFAVPGSNSHITTNRGASGIDGNLATVAGTALSSEYPTVALLGDLATLYDLNSLALLKQNKKPMVLVCVNNDGGGIFSFLPVSKEEKQNFEKLFGMPHGLEFSDLCKGFDLSYSKVQREEDFVRSFQKALTQNKTTFLEVTSHRENNIKSYLQLLEKWNHE